VVARDNIQLFVEMLVSSAGAIIVPPLTSELVANDLVNNCSGYTDSQILTMSLDMNEIQPFM